MNAQRLRRSTFLTGIAFGSSLLAQSSALSYPSARRADVVDDYFGTNVVDPYRWMEDLDSPELKQWVDTQNALAFRYLNALPQRDALKARITELWNYQRVTPPQYEGGYWFYSRTTGLQRQSVVFMRETLDGPETVVLDPNSLSQDGSLALSAFVPAPDGRHFAYGQSQGGSDWSTYYVRELGTGRELADVIRWVRSLSVAWTKVLLRTVPGTSAVRWHCAPAGWRFGSARTGQSPPARAVDPCLRGRVLRLVRISFANASGRAFRSLA